MPSKALLTRKIEELWRLIRVGKSDACWLWTGDVIHSKGDFAEVPVFLWVDGKYRQAPRLVWMQTTGLPLSLCPSVINQTCGNRLCCNPGHFPQCSQQRLTSRKKKTIDDVMKTVGPKLRKKPAKKGGVM